MGKTNLSPSMKSAICLAGNAQISQIIALDAQKTSDSLAAS